MRANAGDRLHNHDRVGGQGDRMGDIIEGTWCSPARTPPRR
jgi:hypothetical protein